MACCASVSAVCHKDGGAFDCCKTEGQRQQHFTPLTVAKASPVPGKVLVVSVILGLEPSPAPVQPPLADVSPRLLNGASPPLYLLAGAFLI